MANREIKFRAWDNHYSTMLSELDTDELFKRHGIDMCQKLNFILMQYTGLKDRNGVEIYEGDIVECGRNGKRSYVEWLDEGACFIFRDKSGDDWWCPNCDSVSYSYSVIGNLYENSELLKGE